MNTDWRAFEESILRALPAVLEEGLGAPVRAVAPEGSSADRGADAVFDLDLDGRPTRMLVEVKRRVDRRSLAQILEHARTARDRYPDAAFIVAAASIAPAAREELARAGVGYADLGGSVHLRAPGVLVRVDGGPAPAWAREARSDPTINPFSDKASFVLRALLDDPGRGWRVTDVAEEAELTKGWVSLVAAELVRRGYAARSGAALRLEDAEAVLRDWSAAYAWRRNRVRSYVAPYVPEELPAVLAQALEAEPPGQAALTLLAALDRIAPHVQNHGQTHLYVAGPNFEGTARRLEKALYLEPVARGGGFHLVLPYYRKSALFRARAAGELLMVSDVQLYLDLHAYPVRGHEAARMLLRTVLAPRLGLERDAVDRLMPE
jgi:Transcriptional regulator, AbiEi antitoxin, Type IV TA system/Restriction endonuclease